MFKLVNRPSPWSRMFMTMHSGAVASRSAGSERLCHLHREPLAQFDLAGRVEVRPAIERLQLVRRHEERALHLLSGRLLRRSHSVTLAVVEHLADSERHVGRFEVRAYAGDKRGELLLVLVGRQPGVTLT